MCKMNKKKRKLKRMRKKFFRRQGELADSLLRGCCISSYDYTFESPANAARLVKSLNKVLKHKLALTNGAKKELRHE